jgi:biotin carboxylase
MNGEPHKLLVVGGWDELAAKFIGQPVAVTLLQKPELLTEVQRAAACEVIGCDYTDRAELTAQLPLLTAHRFSAVVSFTEYGLEPAAWLADRLGASGLSLHAVKATRDKRQMRRMLSANARPGPLPAVQWEVCTGPEQVRSFTERLPGRKAILKPIDGAGSAGVSLVPHPSAAARAWEWASSAAGTALVLAEEYLTGPEFSVEVVSRAGTHHPLAITEKITTGPPHFIETGHNMPPRQGALSPAQREDLLALVHRTLDAIGMANGASHVEAIITPSGARIVEINTRVGGDRIWELVQLTTGVDPVLEAVSVHLGGQPSPPGFLRSAAIRFFTAPPGAVETVSGLDQAAALPQVLRVHCRVRPGDTVPELRGSADRAGYVMAVADNTERAVAAAEAAVAHIVVHCAPASRHHAEGPVKEHIS